ncbi:hypothetical protein PVAND_014049 [Polypedilum vanderplanki]|uniref:BPTI/Kunitz inhibitor domain-containing protein n=1 Tax=Polypedilum vanderplanki TaxID=319348 RepID=A0A9J6CT17_POLVA|nr:hypothetical protein PVAND_014049 [Polypedilum vanderplanki]
MDIKISFVTLLVICTSFVTVIQCWPIDILSQLTDSSERQLLLRFVEFFNDYSDESSNVSNNSGIQTRGVSERQERCRLPMKRGLCRALLPRWRYDPITKTCSEFKFGGCDGNANNFKTRSECMSECSGV